MDFSSHLTSQIKPRLTAILVHIIMSDGTLIMAVILYVEFIEHNHIKKL